MIWDALLLLLALALLGNFLLIWYLRQLLSRFNYICTNIYDLKEMIDLYMKHLEVVSELEMYLNDPHIEQLMKHTGDLVEQLESYEEFYSLVSSNDIPNIPSEITQEVKEHENKKPEEQE